MTTGQAPRKRQPTLAIVTPWRDHPELAQEYFRAIDAGKPDQLVIVDDGSTEPLDFAAIRIPPSGFCTASNKGLELVETDQVVFLNNDIRLMRDTWLDSLREAIQPGVIVGPLRFDPHGAVDGTPYPYVDGWCAAMTTKDARKLGGWDEEYDRAGPAYFSDNALSFHARMEGFTLREFRPGVMHLGGRTGAADQDVFQQALGLNGEMFKAYVRRSL